MCDEWMPVLELPLNKDQFHRLPRNSAYKYELLSGQVVLTPRPKHFHALLDLRSSAAEALTKANDLPTGVQLRSVQPSDWADLERMFAAAFRRTQPFGSLDDETLKLASRQCLQRTATGGDGPWVAPASFVAEDGQPIGAILITLLPTGDPTEFGSYYWNEPPPTDLFEQRLGRPHLTWVFVSRNHSGDGVGTALLGAVVRALRGFGYSELATTFLLGNDSSAMWHWRNGFQLLQYPGSRRRIGQRISI